jgi:simple sugar transport system permease protein
MRAETKQPIAFGAEERIRKVSSFRKSLIRPELGAIISTVAVFVFFLIAAPDSGMFSLQGVMNWVLVSAQYAIVAVGACLLMIAGEFDLSIGSMIGFSGIIIALASATLHLPMWLAIVVAFALALAIGALNGFVVVRTGLPSFHRHAGGAVCAAWPGHLHSHLYQRGDPSSAA